MAPRRRRRKNLAPVRSRSERDSLGSVRVPAWAYYGGQTQRALKNFPVSGLRVHPALIRAYALVKKACAQASLALGRLRPRPARAILRACDEVAAGRHAEHFPVDVYQAGAGTSTNMNLNEVIANRALEILGRRRGDYAALHPNDHVNMSQSTNDTYPTALHVALLWQAAALDRALTELSGALTRKAGEFRDVVKSARTHLQDAVPVTLGQEFGAYSRAVEACRGELTRRTRLLRLVPLGGTAAGTGANCPPGFRRRAVANLARFARLPLGPCPDMRFGLQSHQPLAAVSGALKELALELIRIANDLRLLASGPATGLGEILLPSAQPGSSIMPGKVNPSLLECLNMVCYQVCGRDGAVSLAAQAGQLDLNVMTPLTAYNLLDSFSLLANFLPVVARNGVRGIRADAARCEENFLKSPSLAALLNPLIGYARSAEVFKEAVSRKVPVAKIVLERGWMSADELARRADPRRLPR